MSILHLVVLALVQGITEFLPISSSGHLILVPFVAGWADQGLLIDVATHVGTLGAVLIYFRRDVWAMLAGLLRLVRGRSDPGARLALLVVAATIPVVVAGLVLDRVYPQGFRSIVVIGWTTLVFGVLLYAADALGMTVRRLEHLRLSDAMVIGGSQILALIPGTSRSGITMTAARLLGFDRTDAARFSLLLSMPTILGAGVLKGLQLWRTGDAQLTGDALLVAGLALVAALVAIALMMAWLRRATFTPFVVYRVVLGLVLLAVGYGVFG
ncbi:MAG: undecaprenyl-diphosphate phosphatase [Rhodospirillales bacterium]